RSDIGDILEKLEFKTDFMKKPVSSYSKGMRQRVSMARALISSPQLLFLDEPTSGLDPSGAVLFRKIIEEEREKGTTVFLTTHNMLDADLLCDRVAFITNGNIVALDTPKRLKEQNSSHRVRIAYLYQGRREEKTIEILELERGIPFRDDEIISVHSEEPTLEDMFIQYTGRGLA
ncbi:MAG: ABC transporter ATP-binding protein, partial [Lachnospiraceae bacterium]|nr:ABC transporter ATP-binding protein [Lachnospiraceae bacterium]